jgi:DNA gyrase/topoisomerase IV subunit B
MTILPMRGKILNTKRPHRDKTLTKNVVKSLISVLDTNKVN